MRISDWSSDVCSSDLDVTAATAAHRIADLSSQPSLTWDILMEGRPIELASLRGVRKQYGKVVALDGVDLAIAPGQVLALLGANGAGKSTAIALLRSEEHTSELQSLMRNSYAVFC